jgi:hypothetical protein
MTDELPPEAIPFQALSAWLREHHFHLTDKQTCLRLTVFLAEHARLSGVPEDRMQQVIHNLYHPRAKRVAVAS